MGQLNKIYRKDITMNKDILEGKWKQIRGEAKSWWGKLTDDDLDRAAGKYDVIAGLLQEKYGYNHQRAVEEIDKHVTEFETNLKKKVEPKPVK
jgi:uncharacterized protein YjbJ (UPF0337 family)